MYRYRGTLGVTRKSLDEAAKHIGKLGRLRYVRGYFYRSKHGPRAGVIVRGENGSARFGGFSWGYSGEGPRGLGAFLESIGVAGESLRRAVSHEWDERIGEHWRIELSRAVA